MAIDHSMSIEAWRIVCGCRECVLAILGRGYDLVIVVQRTIWVVYEKVLLVTKVNNSNNCSS